MQADVNLSLKRGSTGNWAVGATEELLETFALVSGLNAGFIARLDDTFQAGITEGLDSGWGLWPVRKWIQQSTLRKMQPMTKHGG